MRWIRVEAGRREKASQDEERGLKSFGQFPKHQSVRCAQLTPRFILAAIYGPPCCGSVGHKYHSPKNCQQSGRCEMAFFACMPGQSSRSQVLMDDRLGAWRLPCNPAGTTPGLS